MAHLGRKTLRSPPATRRISVYGLTQSRSMADIVDDTLRGASKARQGFAGRPRAAGALRSAPPAAWAARGVRRKALRSAPPAAPPAPGGAAQALGRRSVGVAAGARSSGR